MEICRKIFTPHAPPFKVTHGHWNRHGSIGYLLLPMNGTPKGSADILGSNLGSSERVHKPSPTIVLISIRDYYAFENLSGF